MMVKELDSKIRQVKTLADLKKCYTSTYKQSINQSIILFADTNVSQWAHAIQRSIDYVINNPTLNTEIA